NQYYRTAYAHSSLTELVRKKKTQPVVPNTTKECREPPELQKGNNQIAQRPAARQLRLILLIALKHSFLFGKVDQLFATPFIAQRCELVFGNLKKDVDESVA